MHAYSDFIAEYKRLANELDLPRSAHRISLCRILDMLPTMNGGDSRWRLRPLLGCFLLRRPRPQRVAVLHGLHRRLVSPPARRRE